MTFFDGPILIRCSKPPLLAPVKGRKKKSQMLALTERIKATFCPEVGCIKHCFSAPWLLSCQWLKPTISSIVNYHHCLPLTRMSSIDIMFQCLWTPRGQQSIRDTPHEPWGKLHINWPIKQTNFETIEAQERLYIFFPLYTIRVKSRHWYWYLVN